MMGVAEGVRRVLSIQSHTVRGHVGNKAATFPLQVMGFEVDAINSVQLSNHTGYPVARGQVLSGSDLRTLFSGIVDNDLVSDYTHILSGYIGSLTFLDAVTDTIQSIKEKKPGVSYVCDPVLGDNGSLYVPEELIGAYKKKLLPLATLITPNQFEVETLLEKKVETEEDAWIACENFHKMGPETIIVTSLSLPEYGQEDLVLLGSTKAPQREGRPKRFRLRMERIPLHFTGSGDLLAALLLARAAEYPDDISHAIELSVASLQSVLRRTAEAAEREQWASSGTQAGSFRARELRLIQSLDDLRIPKIVRDVEAYEPS